MNLSELLNKYMRGQITIDYLQRQISVNSIEEVGNNLAKLDIGREARKEIPEVILANRKEYKDILEISLTAIKRNGQIVVSKVPREYLRRFQADIGKRGFGIELGRNSNTFLITENDNSSYKKRIRGKIGILAAGTSDIGVAEEARLMAKAMRCMTFESYDVGIAGIHRLFKALQEIVSNSVGAIVVVAGMEGALASVVSAIVNVPVIGVPTSVGYGFGSDGVAALASMLQTCAFGLAVVNIDNGIGAGAFAALVANNVSKRPHKVRILGSETKHI
jgi:NCAIR mutase (PurE)-related protein